MKVDPKDFYICYAHMTHPEDEDYGHFFKYSYRIKFDITDKTIHDVMIAEKWCEEHFGKLDEYDVKCLWQVVYDTERIEGTNKLKEQIFFLFHREMDAMAFKLAWT